MTYDKLLLYYARKGPVSRFRKSAFRKFCRRNKGRKICADTKYGFRINTVIGDSVDNRIAVYGVMEPATTVVIQALSAQCSAFIDVGCNIGYYSALFGSANPGKPLISIDPNPRMIERTRENLVLNRIEGQELLNCGIGEKHGTLELNIPKNRHSLSSFAYVPQRGGPSETIRCEVHPLAETILERMLSGCFIKVDTEGFEYEVFSGLSEESISRIHFILFELASSNLKMAGHIPSDIFSLPLMKQFDVYLVHEDMGGCIKKTNPDTISDSEKLNLDVLLVRRAQETETMLRKAGVHIKE